MSAIYHIVTAKLHYFSETKQKKKDKNAFRTHFFVFLLRIPFQTGFFSGKITNCLRGVPYIIIIKKND